MPATQEDSGRVLLRTGLQNGTTQLPPFFGGSYVVEAYGTWDSATATVQYSTDNGTTWRDAAVAALVGATADVTAQTIVFGRGTLAKLVVASGGGSEDLTWSVRWYGP